MQHTALGEIIEHAGCFPSERAQAAYIDQP